jgi:aminopeptidase-like protein
MRSKYGAYPEYHTSDDDLKFISPSGLYGAFELYKDCIDTLEANGVYAATTLCEPNLGRRGLYPTISKLERVSRPKDLLNFLTYCDGERTLLDIARILNLPLSDIKTIVQTLLDFNLIKPNEYF